MLSSYVRYCVYKQPCIHSAYTTFNCIATDSLNKPFPMGYVSKFARFISGTLNIAFEK